MNLSIGIVLTKILLCSIDTITFYYNACYEDDLCGCNIK